LFLTSEEYYELTLHHILVGIVSVTLLAACGQGEPQPQAEPTADEAPEEDFPDLILPENE
jgi:hypothetical protein